MTPDLWKKVRGIFEEAVEKPPESRGAFVSTATAGDPELAAAVSLLLSAEEKAGTFLETPAVAGAGPREETDPPGTRRANSVL